MGTILPAKSLSNEALQASRTIFENLGKDVPAFHLVGKLPDGTKLTLEPRSNGCFSLSDMKPMFKKLGIDFARQGKETKHLETVVLRYSNSNISV